MRKQSLLALCAVTLALLLSCGREAANDTSPRPHIFLITVDTLRADHLGGYGYSRDTSPSLDRFARDALVFERCQSHAPNTRPSIASLLTGFLPHETRVIDGGPLPADFDTLAEILQREGYQTRAVVSNWVLRPSAGMNQGFEVYDAEMQDRELNRKHWPERVAERTTDAAIALLKDRSEAPLFLWVHYQDPHGPYTPPASFAAQFRVEEPPRELQANASLSGIGGIPSYQLIGDQRNYHEYVSSYDGEIRYVDTHFQRLIDAIQERGLYNDALIVFTADHGEAMGERNFFFAHGSYLYNNLTHVPLIVRHGDRLSGRRSDFCQLIDVVPTILTLLGLDLNPRLRGRNLLDERASSSPIYAETRSPVEKDGRKFSLLLDGFKLIHVPKYETYELFDLSSDPGEEHNLAPDPMHAARLRDLLARLQRIRADDRLGMARQTPPLLTDEEREKLRSLGYLE